MSNTVLIVEDEIKLAEIMRDYLTIEGFDVEIFHSGGGVVDWVRAESPLLILLDIMLPEQEGTLICQRIREFSDVPILMMTARVGEQDCIRGLENGADDYLCKPVRPAEVVARVKAVLRRFQRDNAPAQNSAPELTINQTAMEAFWKDQRLNLTPIEFHLLSLFMKDARRVYTRPVLMDLIYQDRYSVSDRAVDTHVKNLRKKLVETTGLKNPIKSVYGLGYKFELEEV